MYEKIKIALGVLSVAFIALVLLASRYPHVPWLRHFRHRAPELTPEQERARKRQTSLLDGLHFIFMGVCAAFIYVVMTVAFFNDFEPGMTAIVGAVVLACIGLGVWSIRRGREP